jgi:hypothetical protein
MHAYFIRKGRKRCAKHTFPATMAWYTEEEEGGGGYRSIHTLNLGLLLELQGQVAQDQVVVGEEPRNHPHP